MLLAWHPEVVAALREPDEADPWRVLVSGCIYGWGCGIDGSSYRMDEQRPPWFPSAKVRWFPFCPEQEGIGTPRTMPDLHGGDGEAVLDGQARVLDEHGVDLTEGMLRGARAMLAFAVEHNVDLAVLTDMSAACGSQVISDGCRFETPRRYQWGVGVATALLLRSGIPVVSQRDHQTLAALHRRLGGSPTEQRPDHQRHPWVIEHMPPPDPLRQRWRR